MLAFDFAGRPGVQCRRGSMLIGWLVALALITLATTLILLCRGQCWRPRWQRQLVPTKDEAAGQQQQQQQQAGASAGATSADADLATALLEQISKSQQAERRAFMQRLAGLLGCQAASWMNQAEHLESLLVSHLSTTEGNYAAAVGALYESLLGPYERWLSHLAGSSSSHWHGLAASSLNGWEAPDTAQQLMDVSIYLLLWGEAGNLRFMPELLLFLFALARAHCVSTGTRADRDGDRDRDEGSGLTALRHSLPASPRQLSVSPRRTSVASEPGSFLKLLVRPLYNCVFDETFVGLNKGRPVPRTATTGLPTHPRNYDDWNQQFWSAEAIRRLRTHSGVCIMSVPPAERWGLLLQSDWRAFFGGSPKTFREERWWGCLIAANRRVFLAHAFCFGCVVVCTRPPSWSASFNGWGSAFLGVFVLILAPLSSAAGALFEFWSTDEAHVRVALKKRLAFTFLQLTPFAAATVGLVSIQSSYSLDELEHAELSSTPVLILLGCAAVLLALGLLFLLREMAPQIGLVDSIRFDAHLQWEARVSMLSWTSWFTQSQSGRWPCPKPELLSVLQMYGFWFLVWAAKLFLAGWILVPTLFDLHRRIADGFSRSAFELAYPASSLWSWLSEPSRMLQASLQIVLWSAGAMCFLADTLFWYNVVLGLVGGLRGLAARGVGKSESHAVHSAAALQGAASEKLLEGASAAWMPIWRNLVGELYNGDLVTDGERCELLEGSRSVRIQNAEARRRLHHFARSLSDPMLQPSTGALRAPGLTVLVPHYGETILVPYESLATTASDVGSSKGNSSHESSFSPKALLSQHHSGMRHDALYHSVMGFLVAYARDEWTNFTARLDGEHAASTYGGEACAAAPGAAGGTSQTSEVGDSWRSFCNEDVHVVQASKQLANQTERARKATAVRVWASLRLQTLYRTLAGMMKNRTAFSLLLRAALPALPEHEHQKLLDLKFRCVAALQRYAVMAPDELSDVEYLLAEFPSLTVAYIAEEKDHNGNITFFSQLTDGHCQMGANGRRKPKHSIELPGHPILGNGKSDNQNHAIIFSRGSILQAIECASRRQKPVPNTPFCPPQPLRLSVVTPYQPHLIYT